MHSLREHVHRLNLPQPVAAFFPQDLQVPGQGGGVAGDVDEAGGGAGDESVQKGAVAAGPGRVQDDDIRDFFRVLAAPGGEDLFGSSDKEIRVFDPV